MCFSAWGEGTFLAIQTALIGALVLYYGGSSGKASVFLASYVGLVAVLISEFTPEKVLWTLQASNVPIIVAAKVCETHIIIFSTNSSVLPQ